MNSSHSTPLSVPGAHPLLSRFTHPFSSTTIPPPLEKTLMSATNPFIAGGGAHTTSTGLAQNRYLLSKQAPASTLQATPKTYGSGHQYLGSYGLTMDTAMQSLIHNDFLVGRSDIASSQPNLLSHSHLRGNTLPTHAGLLSSLGVSGDSSLIRQNSLSSSNFHGRESQLDLYKQHRLASDALARQGVASSSDPALYDPRNLLVASKPHSYPEVQKMKQDHSSMLPAVAAATAQTLAIQDFYNLRRSEVHSVYQPHKTSGVPTDYHSRVHSSVNPKHQVTDAINHYYTSSYNNQLVKQKEQHQQQQQQQKQVQSQQQQQQKRLQPQLSPQTQQKHHQSVSYAQIQARYAAYTAEQQQQQQKHQHQQQPLSFAPTLQGSQAWSAYSKSRLQVTDDSSTLLSSSVPPKYSYESSFDQYNRVRGQHLSSHMTSPLMSKSDDTSSLKKANSSMLLASKNHCVSPNVQVKAIAGSQNRQIITEVSKEATVSKSRNSKCSVIVPKPPMPQLIHKDQITNSDPSKRNVEMSSDVQSKNKNIVHASCEQQNTEVETKGNEKLDDEDMEPLDLSLSGDKQKSCESNDDDVLCLDDHITSMGLPKKPRKFYIDYEQANTSDKPSSKASNFVSPAVSPASKTTKDTRLASIDDVIRNALASANISNLINPVNFEKHWMRARQRFTPESDQSEFQKDHFRSSTELKTYHSNRLDLQENISNRPVDDSSLSKHLKHVPPAVPCHVLNIAPEIELQDDSMHQVNLVEVKRVPNIHQFGWPRYKNKSKQMGVLSTSSINGDTTKTSEANNSRRPFSIIKFKTDKAMRTDTMAESMLVWTTDSTQPYLVKPVVTPPTQVKKSSETEDCINKFITSSNCHNNNNHDDDNDDHDDDNTSTINKSNNIINNNEVDDTTELNTVSFPKTVEDSGSVSGPTSRTSSNEEKTTNDNIASEVSEPKDPESAELPKKPKDVERNEEEFSKNMSTNSELSQTLDNYDIEESASLSPCRESISPKSNSFEFQDDETSPTSSGNHEKRPKEIMVRIPTGSPSPEIQKPLVSGKLKCNKFSSKTSPKNRTFASNANGSYQNFFHKMKPDKIAGKNLKKYQKSLRNNSYSSIVTDSLSEQIAKVKRKLELDLFGSENQSIQLKQIHPSNRSYNRSTNISVKKEFACSRESPVPELHTPSSHSPEPRSPQSRSSSAAKDITNSSKDTPSDFLNNYNVESFPHNGITPGKGEKIMKFTSNRSPKSSPAKNNIEGSEFQSNLGSEKLKKKDSQDVKGPQICSTREKKKTVPFDEKESEEIGMFLTPKALKAQEKTELTQQMLEYYKKKNMQREGRLTRARVNVATPSSVAANKSCKNSCKSLNRPNLRESMAQFCRKRKLQEAKKPVRAYSTYKSLEVTCKKEEECHIKEDNKDETEEEAVACKITKVEDTSSNESLLQAEPSQSETQAKQSAHIEKLTEKSSLGGTRVEEMQLPNHDEISVTAGTSETSEHTTANTPSTNSFSECSQNNGMSHLLQNPEFNIDTENMRIKISLEFKQHNRANQLANSSSAESSLGSTTSNISSVTISQASPSMSNPRNITSVSTSKKNLIISKNYDSSDTSSSNSLDRSGNVEAPCLDVNSFDNSSRDGNSTAEQVLNETDENEKVVIKTEVKDEIDQIDEMNCLDDKMFAAASSKNDSELEINIPPELKSIKLNRKLGETWMHRAATTNSETIFDYAIKLLGSEGVNEADMTGRNALHLAAMTSNVEIARKLIQHGAGVNEPNTVNGTTCLHEAATSNNIEMIQFLLANGADISQKNFMGATVSETENLSRDVDYFIKAAIYDRYRANKIDSSNLAANFNPFILSQDEMKDENMSDWDDDVKMSELVHFNQTLPPAIATAATSSAATEIAENFD